MIDYEKKNGFYTFTFYKCIPISNPSALRQRIRKQAANLQIIGTIMLTEEGINSTISSISLENLNKMITLLKRDLEKLNFVNHFQKISHSKD
jgi:predicted sulfurtransferase